MDTEVYQMITKYLFFPKKIIYSRTETGARLIDVACLI